MKAVILAAGSSSRFKPVSDNRHKGLTTILGKPVIQHTIDELEKIGVDEIIVVQGPEKQFEEELESDVEFVVQENPKGMGNALRNAEHLLDGSFLVLNPYHATSSHIIEDLIEKSSNENTELGFVSRETEKPEDYGVLHIENDKAVGVTEKPDPEDAPSSQRIVGMYLLNQKFFDYLDTAEEWEYQFEDALDQQLSEKPGSILFIEEETVSIKYPWNISDFLKVMLDKKSKDISQKAEIADSAEIKGKVIVDDGAKIYENSVIRGPAYIGKHAVIGNNSLVRANVAVEENVTIGANCEVKNSVFQPESSIHSGFIGDSVIGRNTKIGAGTITANREFRDSGNRPEIKSDLIAKEYDKNSGKTSLGVFIGDNVDIGVNVSLMPGVQIGSNSRVGPGTVVHENVEKGETVYVKQEQMKKEGEK